MRSNDKLEAAMNLIADARAAGVRLSIVRGQVVGSPDEKITPQIDADIRANLREVAAALRAEMATRSLLARLRRKRSRETA
ncbi:MAG: hypothetical protein AMXMBFR72_32050 [Betaproteobacteria bacterium]